MKNLIKISTTFIILIAVFFSCRNNETLQEEKQDYTALLTRLKTAGKEHNKGLDLFLYDLKNNPKSLKKLKKLVNSNTGRLAAITEEQLINDLNDLEFGVLNQMQEFDVLTDNQLQDAINIANTGIVSQMAENGIIYTDATISGRVYFPEDEQYLTPKLKELLDILQSAIDGGQSYEETLSIFNEIENRSITECTEQEKVVITSAINIGKSSLGYWYNKSSELQTLRMRINPSAARRPFPWKLLAGSDVGGAIAGGVRAAVINLWPGAGQAAYGAAIVGSGVGASAGAVVAYYLID